MTDFSPHVSPRVMTQQQQSQHQANAYAAQRAAQDTDPDRAVIARVLREIPTVDLKVLATARHLQSHVWRELDEREQIEEANRLIRLGSI